MIWIIGLGLPIVVLIFLGGWLVGYNRAYDMSNWGTGFDAGWTAREKAILRRALHKKMALRRKEE